MSSKKINWTNLPHAQQVEVLASKTNDQIVQDYELVRLDEQAFRSILENHRRLWEPNNLGSFKKRGRPPTKDVVLGAWRDLDRSEALLELIDNSIDVWNERSSSYPAKTPKELNVYIDIDIATGQLTYEDNAGGVPEEKLDHLVVPGCSDTTPLSPTIGSYKTGGKKAIFRLATAARISTRYWNPAETSDEAWSLQLDEKWIMDPELYEFPYAELKDKSTIEKGQTRYVLQLREEPLGGNPWFQEPDEIKKVTENLRRTYTLLLIRNPSIRIHFNDRGNPLVPLDTLYQFSGTNENGVDIQPQQINFKVQLRHEGKFHDLNIEIVMGCRTSTGNPEGKSLWGIDLYGNNRLFVAYDQETFADLLPGSNAQRLIRGFVNIQGANVFIPWDTHKRHLNVDRDIMRVLKHKLIRDFFDNWKKAYLAIQGTKVTSTINNPLPKAIDPSKHDLYIPHRESPVTIDLDRKKGIELPVTLFVPKVRPSRQVKDQVILKLPVTSTEVRLLCGYYGVEGEVNSSTLQRELSTDIKKEVLGRARKKGGK